MRIDTFLSLSGQAKSRTHAQNLIKLGKVTVDGLIIAKPSHDVTGYEVILVDDKDDFASLGGLKLQKAIIH